MNKQVVDYEPTSEGINITFADGSKEEGDFLIIADGTHSKLRNKICGETIERKYVGYINFNAAVPQSVVQVSSLLVWINNYTIHETDETAYSVGQATIDNMDSVRRRRQARILHANVKRTFLRLLRLRPP